jgi:putative flippase GtrA
MTRLFRFIIVGALNTFIDFGLTNLLVYLLRPEQSLALFSISLFASFIATINSYFMNRTWTFQQQNNKNLLEAIRFFAIAGLALLVNASMFLFSFHFLSQKWGVGGFLGLNIAKCFGAASGLGFSFIGYRFIVFYSEPLLSFRSSFSFPEDRNKHLLALFSSLALFIGCCLFFFHENPIPARGAISLIAQDSDFINEGGKLPFSGYFDTALSLLPISPFSRSFLFSFLPSVAMLVILFFYAKGLFGFEVAFASTLFSALHPRLIEFACNGKDESLFLFFSAFTLYSLSKRQYLLTGIALGLLFLLKKESLFFIYPLFLWLFFSERKKLWLPFVALGGFILISLLSPHPLNPLSRNFFLREDFFLSPKEIWGPEGLVFSKGASKLLYETSFLSHNISELLLRFPIAVLSPLPLFVLLFFIFTKKRPPLIPLYLLLCFPLLTYLFLKIETRNLLVTLIPIHILGAAGLFAFSCYFEKYKKLFLSCVSGLSLIFFSLFLFRAEDIKKETSLQLSLAKWVKENIPQNETIAGCGNGYIKMLGFLSDRPTKIRILTDNPEELLCYMRAQKISWLILYSPFIDEYNPGLKPYFEGSFPTLEKRGTFISLPTLEAKIYFLH